MAYNLPVKLMNITLVSLTLSFAFAWAAFALRLVLPVLLDAMLWHTAASGVVVSLLASSEGIASRSTGWLGKCEDGRVPWLWWLPFWPFHAITHTIRLGYRWVAGEPLYSRIEEGFYLGGIPTALSDLPPGPPPALLDMTCEMSRRVAAPAYKCVRTWETHGLLPEQLEEGVQWALAQRAEGRPVLVYCTHGHARSAVMLCALLLAAGLAGSPLEAREKVVRCRPGVRPNARQWGALERWWAGQGKAA